MPTTESSSGTQASASSKSTATITDRHGARSIKLQKPAAGGNTVGGPVPAAGPPAETLPAKTSPAPQRMAAADPAAMLPPNGIPTEVLKAPVNRKKQKRRLKQAARAVPDQQQPAQQMPQHDLADAEYAGEHPHAHHHHHHHHHNHYHDHGHNHAHVHEQGHAHMPRQRPNAAAYQSAAHGLPGPIPGQFEPALPSDEYEYYSDEEEIPRDQQYYQHPLPPLSNGHAPEAAISSKKSKKKKKKPAQQQAAAGDLSVAETTLPPVASTDLVNGPKKEDDRIWNTSTQEEKRRIKAFWLSLREEDRRSLVKVEKDAVLRKMKEQQKHSCSCNICGRKRTAIEEELEVLYDAYYRELELYANHQQGNRLEPPPPMTLTSQGWAPQRAASHAQYAPPAQVYDRSQESYPDEGSLDEEQYSDDEDYSEDDLQPPPPPRAGAQADFFNFGNSLTVQGGILTVADDLLKNNGKEFIEMMEQLAERRMQRENDPHAMPPFAGHPPALPPAGHNHLAHNHGPGICSPDEEDEEYDDEDEDDGPYDEDEEYEDEDEAEPMTEEQRMEEGRRMFQLFAARMFEQRVLAAYREKVAQERQQKLLEELEEESRADLQREQKKAKEAAKKKDKKAKQKQAKEEEKAKREAEKAAEEAAAKAEIERKAEEQRQKREEAKRKKEAERKAAEDERLKKEAAKLKRLADEKARATELDRKQKEAKESERLRKEDAKKKERDDRIRERQMREDQERKDREREEAARKSKKEAKARKENAQPSKTATAVTTAPTAVPTPQAPISIAKRPSVAAPVAAAPMPQSVAQKGFSSPHLPVATPVIPKAPTPSRARQPSTHGSVTSSPSVTQANTGSTQSSSPSANAAAPLAAPPGITLLQRSSNAQTHPIQAQPIGPPPGVTMPPNPAFAREAQMHAPPPFPNVMGVQSQGFPPPIGAGQFRGFPPGHAPGPASGLRPQAPVPSRAFIEEFPGFAQQMPNLVPFAPPGLDPMLAQGHARQSSGSFESPMSRPAPIQRPTSPGHNSLSHVRPDVDDLAGQLGSSALLDGAMEDEMFPTHHMQPARRSSLATGAARAPGAAPGSLPGPSRLGFGGSPFPSALGSQPGMPSHLWGGPFGSALPAGNTWSNTPPGAWPQSSAFGMASGPGRTASSRPVTVRLLICQACAQLSATASNTVDGSQSFHDIGLVLTRANQLKPPTEADLSMQEMEDIVETEGDAHNGGGEFILKSDGQGRRLIKHDFGPAHSSMLPSAMPGIGMSMMNHGHGHLHGQPGRVGVPGEIGSPAPPVAAFPVGSRMAH